MMSVKTQNVHGELDRPILQANSEPAAMNVVSTLGTSALVADDDPIARKMLVKLLTQWGYDVVAVSNGEEAIHELEKENGPELAVLDRMMDGADGIEVCQRVRAISNSRYIYIILVTSRDQQTERIEGLSAGADDYLIKPFDPRELRARLETGSRICLQRALRESEMRFQDAVQCSGVGMAIVDANGRWEQVNQAFADFFGYTKEEVLKSTFRDLTHPEDLETSEDLFRKLITGQIKNFQIEKRYLHKDGKTIWGLLTVSSVKSRYGPSIQAVSQIQDVTKKKAAEKALEESEALFRAITENADELIAVTDRRGTILYTSPAYQKHLGYSPDDLAGAHLLEHVHPDDREMIRRRSKHAMEPGTNTNVQIRLQHKDGSWRTVDSHGSIVRNAQNGVERFVTTSRIIDEWLAARVILEEREEQLQLILDSTAEAIFGIDRDGNCTFCNTAFLRVLQYQSVDELLGKNIHLLIHHSRNDGSTYPIEECAIYKALAHGEEIRVDGEVLWRADGTSFPAEYWSHPVLKNGEIVGLVVTFIDITERKNAEAHLREAHKESELVINSVPTILIGLDTSGRITQWNLAAREVFGLVPADVRGKSLLNCGIKWLDQDIEAKIYEWLDAKSVCRVDNIHFQKDGETRLLGFTVTPVEFANQSASAVLIIGADTTQRKAMEEQLRQSQKLEAIGQLAAGIAHEINTPTQFVGDNTTFIKDSWQTISSLLKEAKGIREEIAVGPLGAEKLAHFGEAWDAADFDYLESEVPRAIDQTLEGIKRVANIVKAMKEFSHPGSELKKPIDINHAIETTLTVARNEWRYVADVKTYFGELPMVPCLAGEFNQAILNLIINAAHAIGDVVGHGAGKKGLITLRTRRDGEWVEISIQDTGIGIPESIASRVFEPFFTTKAVGRGTGQGLTLVHGVVVKKHGGKIWFETKEKKGTTFFIRLPLNDTKKS